MADCFQEAAYKVYCEHREEARRKEAEALRNPKVLKEPEQVADDDVEVVEVAEAKIMIKLREKDGSEHRIKLAKVSIIVLDCSGGSLHDISRISH